MTSHFYRIFENSFDLVQKRRNFTSVLIEQLFLSSINLTNLILVLKIVLYGMNLAVLFQV